jgi:hypothetical protein
VAMIAISRIGKSALLAPPANPAVTGEGPIDYFCPQCKSVLISGSAAGQVRVPVQCAQCRTISVVPEALDLS